MNSIWIVYGPVHKGINHVPKTILEHDSDPFLIWKPDFTLCERKALSRKGHFWIMICLKSLILRTCERKALSKRDLCVRILDARWSYYVHRSVQILFMINMAFAMLVKAHSSNHEPNQEAVRDPKWLSEHDSLLCEQALCHLHHFAI